MLDARELRRDYPFVVDDDWVALREEQAGWLAPERCIETHLRMAERAGATLRFGAPVARWEHDGDGVRVGDERAAHLVLTAGAWMPELLPELAPNLWIERNVLFWFEPLERKDELAGLPVWIMEDVTYREHLPAYRLFYGFPYDAEHGLKLAGLHWGDRVDPNDVDREPRGLDEERLRMFIRRRLPIANGERRFAKVCMYTNSPDGHFIIDRDGPVAFASACSGHGFKFASAIGELLAGMVTKDTEAPPFLRADRAVLTAS